MPAAMMLGLIVLVALAAWSDLRTRRIPNSITVTGAAAGLLLQAFYHVVSGAVQSLAGAGLGLAIFLVFYVAGGMGAGDVKLFGAVGAFAGPRPWLWHLCSPHCWAGLPHWFWHCGRGVSVKR